MKPTLIAAVDSINNIRCVAILQKQHLQDLFYDSPIKEPQPEAIYRGKIIRTIAGHNSAFIALGNGQHGFLRKKKSRLSAPLTMGSSILVQISSYPEKGKAAPATDALFFKSTYAIITPAFTGINIARNINNKEQRRRLNNIVADLFENNPPLQLGLILRSACLNAHSTAIAEDIMRMYHVSLAILDKKNGPPNLLRQAPDALTRAQRDWIVPKNMVDTSDASFDKYGVWDLIRPLQSAHSTIANNAAFISIEQTRALIAVDINTGNDFSTNAGLKANLALAQELPRQLRLRGFGGQIVLDLAPMAKKYRHLFEKTLHYAFKADKIPTALVGWTPLGHFELQRKRERIPLKNLL